MYIAQCLQFLNNLAELKNITNLHKSMKPLQNTSIDNY